MDFSIIIVTYNSSSDILNCLNSIYNNSSFISFEIIIVDNKSTDQTLTLLNVIRERNLIIIQNQENLGYSSACNIGVRASKGKYLFFCNPDVVILNNIFNSAKLIFANNKIGCMSPKVYDANGKLNVNVYRFPKQKLLFAAIVIKHFLGMKNSNLFGELINSNEQLLESDWVLGGCMFIPRFIFNYFNGFDENYFLYFEDVDLCQRIKDAGYSIKIDNNSSVKHFQYGSVKRLSTIKKIYIRTKSELYYYKKHFL
jgi:hypothetical protein